MNNTNRTIHSILRSEESENTRCMGAAPIPSENMLSRYLSTYSKCPHRDSLQGFENGKTFRFAKKYERHTVIYKGTWTKSKGTGTWSIAGGGGDGKARILKKSIIKRTEEETPDTTGMNFADKLKMKAMVSGELPALTP